MKIHYTHCPVCSNQHFEPFLSCKDFTVSQETFKIVKCSGCGFKFTQDVPDEADIAPYYKAESYVSHTRSKKGLINRLYHLVKNISLKKKLALVSSLTQGRNLIDYGCGTGEFLAICKQNNWNTKGFEPSDDARFLANEYQVNALPLSAFKDQPPSTADIITMWHVLEHVHDLSGTITKIKEVLKPGGKLLIAVPNCSSPDAKKYGRYWAAYDVPRHLYHFEPATMQQLIRSFGFIPVKTLPMMFDSYYVSMLSEKYFNKGSQGLSTIFKGFVTGLGSNLRAAANNDYSSLIYIFEKP